MKNKKPNILYFSQVPWSWIKQRPHFLPEALAEFCGEVAFFALATGKHEPQCFIRENFRVKEVKGARGSAKYSLCRWINRRICKKTFEEAWIKNIDVVMLTYPYQYEFLTDDLKNKKIIYDCMDNIPYFYEGNVLENLKDLEKKLCQNVAYILVSAEKLKKVLQGRYGIEDEKITVVRNAISTEMLEGCLNQKAIGNQSLQSPNLVYVGTVGQWIDFETLGYLAENNPQVTIYMVGPVDKNIKGKTINCPKNLIFEGQKTHDEAIKYIEKADCVILPFMVNELIECVDPVKMYEYITLNKRIVSVYWQELEHFKKGESIFFYSNALEAERLIAEIFKPDVSNKESSINREFGIANTWRKRAEQIYITVLKGVEIE